MKKVNNIIDKKINHLILVLIGNGVLLLILGVLIVWTDFMLRLVMGLATLLVAYVFLYVAYKLFGVKKYLDKIIKF